MDEDDGISSLLSIVFSSSIMNDSKTTKLESRGAIPDMIKSV